MNEIIIKNIGSRSFSKNGRNTIEPQQSSKFSPMGQRSGFTTLDLKKLNTLYNCPDKLEVQGTML
jgi:Astacin (Peptidase family M12A)